jgi:hypothetical protein
MSAFHPNWTLENGAVWADRLRLQLIQSPQSAGLHVLSLVPALTAARLHSVPGPTLNHSASPSPAQPGLRMRCVRDDATFKMAPPDGVHTDQVPRLPAKESRPARPRLYAGFAPFALHFA